jgi:very-short-patch-repair endonuclease
MGYEDLKVGVEYDGEHHWTEPEQYVYDIDRHAELLARGWAIIRVSGQMLRYRPEVIVTRVCAALRAAGAEWPVIARILDGRVA